MTEQISWAVNICIDERVIKTHLKTLFCNSPSVILTAPSRRALSLRRLSTSAGPSKLCFKTARIHQKKEQEGIE